MYFLRELATHMFPLLSSPYHLMILDPLVLLYNHSLYFSLFFTESLLIKRFNLVVSNVTTKVLYGSIYWPSTSFKVVIYLTMISRPLIGLLILVVALCCGWLKIDRLWIYLYAAKKCFWKYHKGIDSRFVKKIEHLNDYKQNIIK